MFLDGKFETAVPFEETKRTSEGEAAAAVAAMKDRLWAYVDETDDELVCYLQQFPLWLTRRAADEFRARHRGRNIPPRYETVAPLLAEFRDAGPALPTGAVFRLRPLKAA
jgi:hypothetical protein